MKLRKIFVTLLAVVLLVAGCAEPVFVPVEAPQAGSRGLSDSITNLTNLELSGDLTVYDGAYFSGTVSMPSGSIDDTEIVDVTRAVQLPLLSFIECTTDAGAAINFTDGADAFPDYVGNATDGLPFTLKFDDTGGSIDTAYVCAQMIVPPDYSSGGALSIRAAKDAETAGNNEGINCKGSINGAALGTVGVTVVSTSTLSSYTCSPTLTGLAAGDALGVTLYITSTGTADDAVSFYGVEFTYTAIQ